MALILGGFEYHLQHRDYGTSGREIVIPAYTVDNELSTSLYFYGHDTTYWGAEIQENFLHLLENFANDTSPANPIMGQLWYDSGTSSLKVYDTSWTTLAYTTDAIASFVDVTGDLMTGSLELNMSSDPQDILIQTDPGRIVANNELVVVYDASDSVKMFSLKHGSSETDIISVNDVGKIALGVQTFDYNLQINESTSSATYARIANNTTGFTSSNGLLVGIDTSGAAIFNQQESLPMSFYTSGLEQMRLDSSGNFMVGTTSTTKKFHVFTGSSGATPSASVHAAIEGSTNTGLTIMTPSANTGYLLFQDGVSAPGYISYNHNTDVLTMLGGNASKSITINSNGVGIAQTGSASGFDLGVAGKMTTAGINFTGYYAANETLKAYRENTFTPTIVDTSLSNAEGQTYATQIGKYTRIGNVVHFSINILITSIGTLSGQVYIDGLPYAPETSAPSAVQVGLGTSLAIVAGQAVTGYATVVSSSNVIRLMIWDSAAGTSLLTASQLSAGGALFLSGHYFTNDV